MFSYPEQLRRLARWPLKKMVRVRDVFLAEGISGLRRRSIAYANRQALEAKFLAHAKLTRLPVLNPDAIFSQFPLWLIDGHPLPSDPPNEETFEWIALLESVLSASERFTWHLTFLIQSGSRRSRR
jgi:hypothetical protein